MESKKKSIFSKTFWIVTTVVMTFGWLLFTLLSFIFLNQLVYLDDLNISQRETIQGLTHRTYACKWMLNRCHDECHKKKPRSL